MGKLFDNTVIYTFVKNEETFRFYLLTTIELFS